MNLILPRRKFLIGSGQLAASLFVAPAIVPINNLMQIDSELNRLVLAFRSRETVDYSGNVTFRWIESAINAIGYPGPSIEILGAYNGLSYGFVRRAEIHPTDYFPNRRPFA